MRQSYCLGFLNYYMLTEYFRKDWSASVWSCQLNVKKKNRISKNPTGFGIFLYSFSEIWFYAVITSKSFHAIPSTNCLRHHALWKQNAGLGFRIQSEMCHMYKIKVKPAKFSGIVLYFFFPVEVTWKKEVNAVESDLCWSDQRCLVAQKYICGGYQD